LKASGKEDNEASMDMKSDKSENENKNRKISLMRNTINTAVGPAGTKQNDVLIKEAL